MTICDLVQFYAPTSGGIRTYIEAKRAEIARRGRGRHVLIVPGNEDRVETDGLLKVYEVAAPVFAPRPPYRYVRRLDKILRILTREQPQVLELGSPYLLPWAGILHSRRYPCLTIGHYHADFPQAYVQAPLASRVGRPLADAAAGLAASYARFLYNRCDLTITGSVLLQERLRAMRIERTALVPLGVDAQLFHPSRRDRGLWGHLGFALRDRVFLFCGRLDEEKRVQLLVDAFTHLPPGLPVRLVLVGEGPARVALADRAAGDRRLRILPYERDRRRLATLLASADVYATAGPHETFGLSVLEAQASGLPVVGVRAGALPERVPAELGWLAAPDSRPALTACLQRAAEEDLGEMGRRARQRVEAEYTWARTFTRLFGIYDEMAA